MEQSNGHGFPHSARFGIGGDSDGSDDEAHAGGGARCGGGGGRCGGVELTVSDAAVLPQRIDVTVPADAADSLRLTTPNGNHIMIPLPHNATEGATVSFELQPSQAAALPRDDLLAIGDGRFAIESVRTS